VVTVLLVRHADIDLPPASADPPLNAAGRARAKALAQLVGAAGVTAVFTSSFTRTKQTVKALASQLGIQPQEAPPALVQLVLSGAAGPAVLVAGHSNTVPQMITALGGLPPGVVIGENEFDNLFVVTAGGPGGASVVRLKYGKSSA